MPSPNFRLVLVIAVFLALLVVWAWPRANQVNIESTPVHASR
jgi:hypothetical protein